MQTSKPNLFILGAPKCGTSALAEYLDEHPDISIIPGKEPHFFSEDLNYKRHNTPERAAGVFATLPDTKYKGAASVWYMFSTVAIGHILEMSPDAKFIAMIRNPFKMATSLHQQLYLSGIEDEPDFNIAWNLQEKRSHGNCLPTSKRMTEPKFLQYAKTCSLGSQLERVLGQISKEQIHIIIFDDFVADTKKAYLDVLHFLNLPDCGKNDFPPINQAKALRSKSIHSLLNNIPESLKKIIFACKGKLGIQRLNISKTLRKLNQYPHKVTHPSPSTINSMRLVFEPEIEKIESLLNINLSHWKQF